jgi:hypothetical protein
MLALVVTAEHERPERSGALARRGRRRPQLASHTGGRLRCTYSQLNRHRTLELLPHQMLSISWGPSDLPLPLQTRLRLGIPNPTPVLQCWRRRWPTRRTDCLLQALLLPRIVNNASRSLTTVANITVAATIPTAATIRR